MRGIALRLAGLFSLGLATAAILLAQQTDPYVGSQMCLSCHADDESSLVGSPHAWENFQAVAEHGCQTCHGPGRAHVQNPQNADLQPRVARRPLTSSTNTT
jgi:hypothetical protein